MTAAGFYSVCDTVPTAVLGAYSDGREVLLDKARSSDSAVEKGAAYAGWGMSWPGEISTGIAYVYMMGAPFSQPNPNLYWHGSKDAVEEAHRLGLFAHGHGSGGKYWATILSGQNGTTLRVL